MPVMQISLNALEHLGMNLYSNVPAVLSEIVANAWDADATRVVVEVNQDDQSVEITDDGIGMFSDGSQRLDHKSDAYAVVEGLADESLGMSSG